MSPWAYLVIAIALGVTGTLLLKLSDGFKNKFYGLASIAFYCWCFIFFAPALRDIPAGVAYAVWSGAGIAIITLFGRVVFKQTLKPVQYVFILLIVIGAVGLNLTTHYISTQ